MSRLLFLFLIFSVFQLSGCKAGEQSGATEGVSVSTEEAIIAVGKEIDIQAMVFPYVPGNEAIDWVSSDPEVAFVEEKEMKNGICVATVKAISVGTATISVTSASDKSKAATIAVEVVTHDFNDLAAGFDYATENLITYKVPEEFPQEGDPIFNVSVDGHYTGVYTDINAWEKLVGFSYFDFTPGKEVEVIVTSSKPFNHYDIFPKSDDYVSSQEGKSIHIKLSKANQKISIVYDYNYKGNSFHLFANPIDTEAPKESSSDLIYFGPGYHNIQQQYGGTLLTQNRSIYIAGGAVVNGDIIANGNGRTISGHGVLMKTTPNNCVLSVSYAKNVTLKDFIICSHRPGGWTVGTYMAENLNIYNVKVVSVQYASTDGFDISNSVGVHLKDVFIRSCDDAIAIKGLAEGTPANCPPNENMTFENLQIWNDCNNAMGIGAETHTKYYKDIHFKNIDVIFSYDDRDNHVRLDERSVMNICCLQGTFFENITWEDIRVNRCERLICITFKDNFWFGSIQGNQSTEGGVNDITYKNVTVESNSGSSIANEILLNGWAGTPRKIIQNVTFDNVVIEGKPVTSESDKHIKTNNTSEVVLVKDLIFK